MGYTYTPAYYSSLQDSITSICKTILPFSLKKRRLTAAEQKLSKQQSDNLKWQQNSFHQILNLTGLQKEGILSESEVSAFRTHLLDTLIAAKGSHVEQPPILRDKLLFLQELLHAKCISSEEYHASKRPLLQRLAVQGAELEARDVIIGAQEHTEDGAQERTENSEEEEWSVIDLKDEESLINKSNSKSKNKTKQHGLSAVKHIKDAASVIGFGSIQKLRKTKEQKSIFDLVATSNQYPVDNTSRSNNEKMQTDDNPFWNHTHNETESEAKSILMSDSLASNSDKIVGEEVPKSAKKQWKFDRLKRWKKDNVEDEATRFPLREKSNDEGPYMQGPDTKQIKKKLLSDGSSSSGFFIDKVVGNNIKKELSRIQCELSSSNPNFRFSNDQMDDISTKLPVDKTDLKQFFPKAWCDRYGDVVLNVVKKEFKDHVGEMDDMRSANRERRHTNSKRWTSFKDDGENCHPNQVSPANHRANSEFF